MVDVTLGAAGAIPPAEVKDVELYHPKSWVTKYVFCQDAKVIAIQYSITALAIGLVALVLSWLMRLQLAFPGTFSFIDPGALPAVHHHARHDHGDLSAHRAVPGGLRQLPDPADGGRPGHGFSLREHAELLGLSARGAGPGGELLRAGRAHGRRLDLYPPQAILSGTPGQDWGIILMLASLILFIIGFTMGGLNYVVTVLQARTRGMTLMRMPLTVWGIFTATVLALLAFPALFVGCRDDAVRQGPGDQLLHAGHRRDGGTA